MSNADRMRLMTETAIDLAMQGFALKDVLTAFAQVAEFRALGSQSFPMARALTSALLGECLEPNTMSFEELLQTYGEPKRSDGTPRMSLYDACSTYPRHARACTVYMHQCVISVIAGFRATR